MSIASFFTGYETGFFTAYEPGGSSSGGGGGGGGGSGIASYFTAYETAYSTAYSPGGSSSSTSVLSYFERDLVAYLNGFEIPVYPGHIPQNVTLPAISFFIVGADRVNRLASSAGIAEVRVQITVSSTSYVDVAEISELLRSKLQGYLQKLMGQTWMFVVLLGNQISQYERGVDASDKGIHSKINEFTFIYRESIPTP